MTIEIDKEMLEEIENFVTSEKFCNFIVNNVDDFNVAAVILQALLEKIEDIKSYIKD